FLRHPTAPPAIYTLSLHDALPICDGQTPDVRSKPHQVDQMRVERWNHEPGARHRDDHVDVGRRHRCGRKAPLRGLTSQPDRMRLDRKSTRLNSSHVSISYAVFCLK